MKRVSTVLFGSVIAAAFALNAGCTVQASVKTKERFIENNVAPSSVPSEEWNGEPIKIDAQGVGVAVNGGLDVTVDPNAKTITASARMLAMADAEDKASADQSIIDAKGTFTITKSANGWLVSCGHGGSHGSSNAGESGCEQLVVTVPGGAVGKALDLTALSGNGSVNIDVSGATLKNLGSNGKGDITVRLPGAAEATKGATVSIVAENADDINALVPSSFSADEVWLVANAEKITNGFSDLTLDSSGKGSRGTAGEGYASIKLTSKEFAGDTGAVSLGPL
jgi:hypothetical protein